MRLRFVDVEGSKQVFKSSLSKYFDTGLTARSATELTGVNCNTGIPFFHKLRERSHEEIVGDQPSLMGDEIEFDWSYLDSRRKGIGGRDSAGLVQVFGLLERNDYVHAKIIPNATAAMLVPVLREKVRLHCFYHADTFRAYDVFEECSVLLELVVAKSEQAIASSKRLSHQELFVNILKLRVQILEVLHWSC